MGTHGWHMHHAAVFMSRARGYTVHIAMVDICSSRGVVVGCEGDHLPAGQCTGFDSQQCNNSKLVYQHPCMLAAVTPLLRHSIDDHVLAQSSHQSYVLLTRRSVSSL
jgi:hypothetical protein